MMIMMIITVWMTINYVIHVQFVDIWLSIDFCDQCAFGEQHSMALMKTYLSYLNKTYGGMLSKA